MKDAEDEAFDELAKRQGAWGGGFPAKRAMAADKLQEPEREALKLALKDLKWVDNWLCEKPMPECVAKLRKAIAAIQEALAQPAQEPVNLLEARRIAAEYGTPDSQVDDGNLYFALSKCLEHIDAQPAQEPDALTIAYQSGFYDGKKSAQVRCIELVLAGSSMPVQTRTLETLQRDRKRIAKLIAENWE
jgi:hypothetical protein